ncbi:MAG: hypothetical protein HOV83_41955 [Catenulispora sp.]|nr:hypothetical protein [Catenulispora sp.]
MTTIPRNHTTVIAALKAEYTYAIGHHKNDAYTACVADAQTAWNALAGHRSATLTRHDNRLKITHPLGWFDLFTDDAAYTATLPAPPARPAAVFPVMQHRVQLGELRRTVPGEVTQALLRNADEALATAGGAQAHITLLAAMAELEQAGYPREAAVVEAIADELAATLTDRDLPR